MGDFKGVGFAKGQSEAGCRALQGGLGSSMHLVSLCTCACFNLKPNVNSCYNFCLSLLFLILNFYNQEKEKTPRHPCLKVRSPPSSCWTNCDITPGQHRAGLVVTPGRPKPWTSTATPGWCRPKPIHEEELGAQAVLVLSVRRLEPRMQTLHTWATSLLGPQSQSSKSWGRLRLVG